MNRWLSLLLMLAGVLGVGRAAEQAADVFTYDIEKYRKVDPKLILYQERQGIAVPLEQPRALAASFEGVFFVGGEKGLVALTADGTVKWKLTLNAPVHCLAVGPDGDMLYTGMRDHIDVRDTNNSSLKKTWPKVEGKPFLSSLNAGDKLVFAADAGNRKVYFYAKDGTVKKTLDGRHEKVRSFIIPSPHFDLATAPYGMLWVVNPGYKKLEHYSIDGEKQQSWGISGIDIEAFVGCCNPSDIAIRSDSHFITAEKGLCRVKVYEPNGDFLGVVAGPEQFGRYEGALDLAVDEDDNVLVLDPSRKMIRVFEEKE